MIKISNTKMVAKSHFDDCPYGCNANGMLLDSNTGNMVQCPYCLEKKKQLLQKGYAEVENETLIPLTTVFGIENEFLNTKFVYESVVPEGELLFIEKESVDWQKDVSEELYLGLAVGTLPESSLCFGLGIKGRIDRFAFPMLAKAYLSGLSVSKMISCSEFNRLSLNVNSDLSPYYNSDLVVMLINEGCNLGDLASAKGLMQSRALKGKPTIFVTTWTIEACSGLLGFQEDRSYFLAKGVFLQYKTSKGDKGHSSYVNGLIGVKNENVSSIEEESVGISMSELL